MLLQFSPYSKDQISEILKARINEVAKSYFYIQYPVSPNTVVLIYMKTILLNIWKSINLFVYVFFEYFII